MFGKKKEPLKRYELRLAGDIVGTDDAFSMAIKLAQKWQEHVPIARTVGIRIIDREVGDIWTIEEAIEVLRSRPEAEVRKEIHQALMNEYLGTIRAKS